jgi:hypothetical protein
MNTDEMAAFCRSEIKRLSAVLAALEGGEGPKRTYTRRGTTKPKRHTMSAAARKKISAAQKARWAKQKAAKKS